MVNLISPEYRILQADYHKECDHWGSSGQHWATDVLDFIIKNSALSVIDYGCGKNTLYETVKNDIPEDVSWCSYDPCVEAFDAEPPVSDLVISTDVLEHVEPELVENVLDDIAAKCTTGAFLVIFTHPAKHLLPDGSNCHKICKGEGYWRPLLEERFKVVGITKGGADELICEVYHAT